MMTSTIKLIAQDEIETQIEKCMTKYQSDLLASRRIYEKNLSDIQEVCKHPLEKRRYSWILGHLGWAVCKRCTKHLGIETVQKPT